MSKNKSSKNANEESCNLIYRTEKGPQPQTINNPYQQVKLIEAQATYYPDMVQVYIPIKPIVSTAGNTRKASMSPFPNDEALEYLELSDKFDEITNTKISKLESENDLERSLRRAKKRIGDYILCNDFDMFATFTIKDDRQNSVRSRQRVLGWLKHQRSRNGKFRYLVVPEYHKDGKSLHFHALLGEYTGKIKQAVNPNTGKPLVQKGAPVFQLTGYTLGFTNVKLIGTTQEDKTRLSAYLKKYITKDMPLFEGKQRYWVSKGLELPNIENNPELWYQHVEPDWWCEFENGTLLRFDLNKHPLTDIFWEENGHAKS